MGNQVHSPHLRVPRRPAIQDGQMPRRDIALTPQLITHPLRHTLLAPATDASHVQLGCPSDPCFGPQGTLCARA